MKAKKEKAAQIEGEEEELNANELGDGEKRASIPAYKLLSNIQLAGC